jgi:predicted phage gp36 major capsid-like protein
MSELETKAGAGTVGAAFEDFMRAFEAFKETNDERLDALERRSAADPLIEEKLSRIDRALDEHRRTVDDLALRLRGRRWAGAHHAQALRSRTRPPSMPTCARANRGACAISKAKPFQSAPGPTAAISSPTRSSAPSTAR